jgi:hypothetical protein
MQQEKPGGHGRGRVKAITGGLPDRIKPLTMLLPSPVLAFGIKMTYNLNNKSFSIPGEFM